MLERRIGDQNVWIKLNTEKPLEKEQLDHLAGEFRVKGGVWYP